MIDARIRKIKELKKGYEENHTVFRQHNAFYATAYCEWVIDILYKIIGENGRIEEMDDGG